MIEDRRVFFEPDLANCRLLIPVHRGRLLVELAPERGAVFHFEIPALMMEEFKDQKQGLAFRPFETALEMRALISAFEAGFFHGVLFKN